MAARDLLEFRLVKAPLLALYAVLLLPAPTVVAQYSKDAAGAQIEASLDEIVIPKLELHDATLQEAVVFLRNEIRSRVPGGRKIAIHLQLKRKASGSTSAKQIIQGPSLGVPDITYAGPDGNLRHIASIVTPTGVARMTISMSDLSIFEALEAVAEVTNTLLRFRADGIHITDLTIPEPMSTRTFRLPREQLSEWKTDYPDPALLNARAKRWLNLWNIEFGKGSSVAINIKTARLTVRNTAAQLDAIAQAFLPPLEPPVPGPEVPKVVNGVIDGTIKTQLQIRMENILIPEVILEDMPLREAVKAVQNLGIRHDTCKRHSKRGVSILVWSPEATNYDEPPVEFEEDPKIHYSAKNVSLWEAVNAVVHLTAYKLRVADDMVALQPPLQPKALVTRVYLLPPFFAFAKRETPVAAPADPADNPALKWLTSGASSFSFPSSLYQERQHRWTLRDTEAEQKRALELVEKAWHEYYSTEEAKKKPKDPR